MADYVDGFGRGRNFTADELMQKFGSPYKGEVSKTLNKGPIEQKPLDLFDGREFEQWLDECHNREVNRYG